MTLDMPTTDISRPSVAKFCVQLDLLKKLPHRVLLECGEFIPGYWQSIEYEKLSKYCKYCRRLGHDVHVCTIAYPLLGEMPPKTALMHVYKQKEKVIQKKNLQKEVPPSSSFPPVQSNEKPANGNMTQAKQASPTQQTINWPGQTSESYEEV